MSRKESLSPQKSSVRSCVLIHLRSTSVSSPCGLPCRTHWNLFLLFYNLSFQGSSSRSSSNSPASCLQTKATKGWFHKESYRDGLVLSHPLTRLLLSSSGSESRVSAQGCCEHPKASSIVYQGAGYSVARWVRMQSQRSGKQVSGHQGPGTGRVGSEWLTNTAGFLLG